MGYSTASAGRLKASNSESDVRRIGKFLGQDGSEIIMSNDNHSQIDADQSERKFFLSGDAADTVVVYVGNQSAINCADIVLTFSA